MSSPDRDLSGVVVPGFEDLQDTAPLPRLEDAGAEQDQTTPYAMASLPRFVEHLMVLYPTNTHDRSTLWCPRWFDHPDVVARLDALWHTWESWRTRTDGALLWFREADYHMDRIMRTGGPFTGCAKTHRPERAPSLLEEPPAGMFPTHPTR